MSIDPHRLMLLRAVRRAGGVQAAARLLHLTPSGVSQHLAKLEAEVGLALVDRSRRGGGRAVRLTPAGHRLADSAEVVAEALAAAERELEEFRPRASGPLRIGGFSVALTELVAPVAMRLAVTQPAFEPYIYEVTEADGLAAILAGDLDLLVSEHFGPGSPARPAGIVELDLLHDPFRIIVPASWPAITDPETLLTKPWVSTSYGDFTRRVLKPFCRRYGVTLDARDIGTGSAPTLLALVANGIGASIIPELTLSQNSSPNIRLSHGIIDPGGRIISLLRTNDSDTPASDWFIAELRRFIADRATTHSAPGYD